MVFTDVPFIMGLDYSGKQKINVNNVSNNLCINQMDRKIQLIDKRGHTYLECNNIPKRLYSEHELVTLHRIFSHSPIDKLPDLLKLELP